MPLWHESFPHASLCIIKNFVGKSDTTLIRHPTPYPTLGVSGWWGWKMTGRLRRHHQTAAAGAVRPD